MIGQTAGKTVKTNKGLLHKACGSPFALDDSKYPPLSSSFHIPFIPQRSLHLGADLAKIGAGLLCAL